MIKLIIENTSASECWMVVGGLVVSSPSEWVSVAGTVTLSPSGTLRGEVSVKETVKPASSGTPVSGLSVAGTTIPLAPSSTPVSGVDSSGTLVSISRSEEGSSSGTPVPGRGGVSASTLSRTPSELSVSYKLTGESEW